MGKLFGTDGIRGRANTHPVDPEGMVALGRAVGEFLQTGADGMPPGDRIVIGMDTRISGGMLEAAFASGVLSTGLDVLRAGVIPTPGIAVSTVILKSDAGVMISASHNPFYDNGVKIFSKTGYKISERVEERLEKIAADNSGESSRPARGTPGMFLPIPLHTAEDEYSDFLMRAVERCRSMFKGMKIVIDCGNGAAHSVAPRVFSNLETDCISLFIKPDGVNINENCGSQHPETLAKTVAERGADAGFAFDGDGDRVVVVDEKGGVLRGDVTAAVCAGYYKDRDMLKNDTVVTSVMSNIGLGIALKSMNIKHFTAGVGDRRVLETMLQKGAILGGEDSGHMIFLDHHVAGDGILAALRVMEAIAFYEKPLSELAEPIVMFPQTLINVPVREKPELTSMAAVADAIGAAEAVLKEKGRVLVRYSGTEPKCRVMVEGPEKEITDRLCGEIAHAVERSIGVSDNVRGVG